MPSAAFIGADAADAFESYDVGAEFFVSVVMAAFTHEIEIEFGKQIRKRVRVVCFPDVAVLVAKPKAITGRGGSGLVWRGRRAISQATSSSYCRWKTRGGWMGRVAFRCTQA